MEIEIKKINGNLELTKSALSRTACLLMDGNVYVRHRRLQAQQGDTDTIKVCAKQPGYQTDCSIFC
jgi:hypothetical protein